MTTTAEAIRPRYRTIDLVVIAGIGAAFGVAFLGYGAFYSLISPLTSAFQPASGLLAGIWILPAVIAGLIVRRPGAAIGAELIAATLEMLLGGQWGWGTVISGIVQGGGVELGFALLAYRRFTLPVALLAGLLGTGLEWVYERFFYYAEMGWGFAILLLVAMAISGLVLGGALGHAAVRALAATGALDPFGPGRERARRI